MKMSAHGYQLLTYWVNREFDVFRHILRVFIHFVWRGTYDHRRPITDCPWLPIVAPSNQSVSG